MGLLDNKITFNYIPGNVTIEQIHEVINNKLKDKYKVELLRKGNGALQFINGKTQDRVFVTKNAYHRTFVSVNFAPGAESNGEDETIISFDDSTLKWWLRILHKQTGFIGQIIISSVYGKNKDFYDDLDNAIKEKFDLKQREQNFGVSALWNR